MTHDYVMGRTDGERARLRQQAAQLDPQMSGLLIEAGVGEGMRVLDIGSGQGDVSLLAAPLVGSGGRVTGIDRDEAQVAAATARASECGVTNVDFTLGDFRSFVPDRPYDAVVGRLVLVHTPDLDGAIATLARLARPGGVIALFELQTRDGWRPRCWPADLLPERFRRDMDLMMKAVGRAQGQEDLAVRLPAGLSRFGTVASRHEQQAIIGRDALRRYCDHGLETIRSVLPAIVAFGIAPADAIDLDALRAELDAMLTRPEAEHGVTDGYPTVLTTARLARAPAPPNPSPA